MLIIIAAVIGGLLLTVAVIVIFLTCRRAVKSSSPNDWPPSSDKTQELQPDGVSNTSSDMKTDTRTTSSLSAHDDLDGSDSLPEYHANYIKSQPTYTNNQYNDYDWYNQFNNHNHYNYNNLYIPTVSPDSDMSGHSSNYSYEHRSHTGLIHTGIGVGHLQYFPNRPDILQRARGETGFSPSDGPAGTHV